MKKTQGLGLNSCVVLRKTLSEANLKKGFNLLGSIKIGLWSDGKRSHGTDESRFTLFQSDGHIMVRRETVRFRFSSIMCPKNEDS